MTNELMCISSQVLSLLRQIDSHILESHMEQLVAASKDEQSPLSQRRELSHRVLEVASILFSNDRTEQYSQAVLETLALALDESIDNETIRLVLRHLRRGELKRIVLLQHVNGT